MSTKAVVLVAAWGRLWLGRRTVIIHLYIAAPNSCAVSGVQAEGLELKASASCAAEAVVVEAKLDKGQGPVATAIVKRGSLEVGQYVVVGCHWGKVRSLRTAAGRIIKKALPGQPVEIAGLKGVPSAGDQLQVLPRYAVPTSPDTPTLPPAPSAPLPLTLCISDPASALITCQPEDCWTIAWHI